MDWYSCAKCIPMPRGIEYPSCQEVDSVQERLMELEEIGCITSHDQFAIVCLNKDIFYTVLMMINKERSAPVHLPLSNRYVWFIHMLLIRPNVY